MDARLPLELFEQLRQGSRIGGEFTYNGITYYPIYTEGPWNYMGEGSPGERTLTAYGAIFPDGRRQPLDLQGNPTGPVVVPKSTMGGGLFNTGMDTGMLAAMVGGAYFGSGAVGATEAAGGMGELGAAGLPISEQVGVAGGAGSWGGGMLGGEGLVPLAATDVGSLGTVANVSAGTTGATEAGSIGGALKNYGGLLGSGAQLAGGYMQQQAARDASATQAQAQIRAAQIAADAAKFRPVGVTTRFGASQFGTDAQGNLTSAGYVLSPEMKAQQDKLMGISEGALTQYQGAQAATAPMGQAAQSMMTMGQGYLSTSPQEQAAKYMAEQQALLGTGRERELASLENRLLQQGRLGMATGGTSTGMMAANPELEAWYNAKRQQDLGLAAQATQGGMDYAKFGAGMVGSGGDMLKQMYGTQQSAYAPYQTALGGAGYIEGLGQQAMEQGINIGAKGTAASAASGGLLAQGMTNAAATQFQANATSPWGTMLSGAGSALQQYGQPQQQYAFNPYTGQPVKWGT